MMNSVQIFERDDFSKVRTAILDGKIIFCANDIAKILGYKNQAKAVREKCKGVSILDTPSNGGIQKMKFISEPDVYRLIFGSKLENAQKFQDWIFEEVIPRIRETGSYINTKDTLYIETRRKSKEIRKAFTDELKEREYKGYEYAMTTNAMKEPFGLKGKKKDDMSQRELETVMASELIAKLTLTDETGYKQVNPVCIKASMTVKNAIENKNNMKLLKS